MNMGSFIGGILLGDGPIEFRRLILTEGEPLGSCGSRGEVGQEKSTYNRGSPKGVSFRNQKWRILGDFLGFFATA